MDMTPHLALPRSFPLPVLKKASQTCLLISCLNLACSHEPNEQVTNRESGGTASGGEEGAGIGAGPATGSGGHASDPGSTPATGGAALNPVSGNVEAPELPQQDPASDGGTITFTEIGAAGSYLSRRDPSSGQCDGYQQDSCCMTTVTETSDALTPWNHDLIMTLRGPLLVKQVAAYQSDLPDAASWPLVSLWDDRNPAQASGIAFQGDGETGGQFEGTVGSSCILDVMTDAPFTCGTDGFCEAGMPDKWGWAGSKMLVLLAKMPEHGELSEADHCTNDPAQGWYNAPWIGMSHGELIRTNKFGSCNCYGTTPPEWYTGEGCGQFNAFEVVNDNNEFQNFDLFSTNFFAYHGYVGGGPCGQGCDLSALPAHVDLVDKSTSAAANAGVSVSAESANSNPGVAFVRPSAGYRYFVLLFDVKTRSVQLALIHPANIPSTVGSFLPSFPDTVSRETVDALLALRLPG